MKKKDNKKNLVTGRLGDKVVEVKVGGKRAGKKTASFDDMLKIKPKTPPKKPR
jgi:hypothetical protein